MISIAPNEALASPRWIPFFAERIWFLQFFKLGRIRQFGHSLIRQSTQAMIAAIAATFTMSSAEQPRDRSWAGFAMP